MMINRPTQQVYRVFGTDNKRSVAQRSTLAHLTHVTQWLRTKSW
jgi:hypothetical protein